MAYFITNNTFLYDETVKRFPNVTINEFFKYVKLQRYVCNVYKDNDMDSLIIRYTHSSPE